MEIINTHIATKTNIATKNLKHKTKVNKPFATNKTKSFKNVHYKRFVVRLLATKKI
jgi:hypothetical protein